METEPSAKQNNSYISCYLTYMSTGLWGCQKLLLPYWALTTDFLALTLNLFYRLKPRFWGTTPKTYLSLHGSDPRSITPKNGISEVKGIFFLPTFLPTYVYIFM
jgi:hypothetical protein